MKWLCTICGYVYDEMKEGKKFESLPSDWVCPECGVTKDAFERLEEEEETEEEI